MVQVSDHAVVRYLERAYGISVDSIRAEMIAGPGCSVVAAMGGTGNVIGRDGIRLVLRDHVVVTVYSKGDRAGFRKVQPDVDA